ncbi:histidine kinase [Sphaerimonospora mesophila]|uniref:GAF domain-containing sensor histidine kinase n=1 Tax=Sphaerimonospora mesophila TaxID=37483 RepID=UPI0006E3E35B
MIRRRAALAALVAQSCLLVWLFLSLWLLPGDDALHDRAVVGLYAVALGLLGGTGITLARRRHHPLAPVLIATGIGGIAFYAVSASVVHGRHHLLGPAGPVLFWLPTWLWLTIPVGVVALLLRFPTGTPLGPWWRRGERVLTALAACLALLVAFLPGGDGTVDGTPNPFGVSALQPLFPLLTPLFALIPAAFLLGAVALAVRYTRSGQVERQQIRWVAAAALVIAPVTAATALLDVFWIAEALALCLLPGAIAVAVLRYRLWDLGLVLRRTLLYTLLTAILLTAYIGLVLCLDAALPTPDLLPEVLVTGVIAVVALPLREILQGALDRMLFGNRRDPHQVVRTLGRLLESTREPLLTRVVDELAMSLRLPYVAVELPDGSLAATAGAPTAEADSARIPLHVSGETVGDLVAARRHPDEPLSPADRRLLTDLAGHLGVVVRAAGLDAALRRSHERLTHIRVEERGRLQRDLHDGLGPLLGAVGMRIAAARNLLAHPAGGQVERADEVLTAAAADLDEALSEVQRIVTDLRPTALVERGLVAALRDQVDGWAGRLTVTMDAPERLPTMDPVTETAAYRIVMEALRNAERHSGGSTAQVRISASGGELTVEVGDNGAGPSSEPVRSGAVGLRSMRERAEALGGVLQVEPGADGGMLVRCVLPGPRG